MKYSALIYALFSLWVLYYSQVFDGKPKIRNIEITLQKDFKEQAFVVLKEKCNVCHATKKKTDIFTLVNMDSLAPDIHKQVFIKRRMPKGRKIKLTESETEHLKVWLDATLK